MLRSALNKREVKIPLGKSQAEMTRRYGPTHDEVEKLFKLTRASLALVPQNSSVEKTDLDLFNEAIERIQSNGWSAELDHADETEREHRQITAELELEKYPQNRYGGYEAIPPEEAAYIKALRVVEKPDPTLLDAKKIYIKDKIAGTARERQNLLRLERALKPLMEIAGKNPPLNQITRKDAKKWVEAMVGAGKSPSNIERTLKPLQAMFKYADLEFALGGGTSPFDKLDLPEHRPEKREALPPNVVKSVREHLDGKGMYDLKHIWLLMEWSGARIGEVSGLLSKHVVLDHEVPHIVIEPHEKRPLKTLTSQRKVPLEGFALGVRSTKVRSPLDS
jgi:integrase